MLDREHEKVFKFETFEGKSITIVGHIVACFVEFNWKTVGNWIKIESVANKIANEWVKPKVYKIPDFNL